MSDSCLCYYCFSILATMIITVGDDHLHRSDTLYDADDECLYFGLQLITGLEM